MSDQQQPGEPPWGANPAGTPPPPPPPPPPPVYPTYPGGQPASPYGAAPGYGAPPGMPPAYGAPVVPYAHWGLRVGAYFLDALLLLPGYIVAMIGVTMTEPTNSSALQSVGIALAVIGYVAAIGFAIWNQILRQGRTGSSLGKQWLDIRVIREDNGQPLGGGLTFGRALLHILDGLPCYLGYLWPLWDPKRQTFADKIVRSVVVRQQTQVPPGPPVSWPQDPRGYDAPRPGA